MSAANLCEDGLTLALPGERVLSMISDQLPISFSGVTCQVLWYGFSSGSSDLCSLYSSRGTVQNGWIGYVLWFLSGLQGDVTW